ncbi:restriction endonuclease subunit S [Wenyingzhuangia marina]|uniref:Type I restriction enzyme, S subunit n=1 Tax=Wenyingzhuangia marina TaxID=1195760 RepID=A0A1M5VCV9_9FLAO|nr:restriction endonuclease subunit S [Wenyingzhuangia marina]GGF72929.1 specificity determinant HsdS [Wenyingzhuangia marina]SHH73080.1 type I restriction enzyme, S subunit [Wenyingzhuangia marina]
MRFKEFQDEWKPQKLGRICTKIGSGKTPKGGEDVYKTTGIPFVRSQNVINNSLILDKTHITFEMHKSMKSSTVLANDILLNITGGSIGRSCVVPNDFIEGNVNQHVSIIRLKKFNSNFLQAILSSSVGQKLIYQGQTGSGREGLNFQSIKSFNIYFPSIKEQNKVSRFLKLINKRIDAQNKIIQSLESLMSGLVQDIFSQKLRFKNDDGNEFPDWESKKLGEICVKKSSNISANTLESKGGKFKIYGAIGFLQFVDFYQEDKSYISIVKDGAGVGRTMLCDSKSSVLGTLDKIIPNNSVNIYFLYMLFKTIKFDKYIIGSTIPHIYFKDYSKLKISIPCIEEQTKISNFLSSINKKIEKEKVLLKEYEQQKKYLLQNLFI